MKLDKENSLRSFFKLNVVILTAANMACTDRGPNRTPYLGVPLSISRDHLASTNLQRAIIKISSNGVWGQIREIFLRTGAHCDQVDSRKISCYRHSIDTLLLPIAVPWQKPIEIDVFIKFRIRRIDNSKIGVVVCIFRNFSNGRNDYQRECVGEKIGQIKKSGA
jgi:hypothetical protein